jgi:hypothetical protein
MNDRPCQLYFSANEWGTALVGSFRRPGAVEAGLEVVVEGDFTASPRTQAVSIRCSEPSLPDELAVDEVEDRLVSQVFDKVNGIARSAALGSAPVPSRPGHFAQVFDPNAPCGYRVSTQRAVSEALRCRPIASAVMKESG